MTKIFDSNSQNQTFEIAKQIARQSDPGDVFALEGDLGSGKTTFVKGFAKALGVEANITSPTFVVLKRYKTSNAKIANLIHIDAYRLSGSSDAESIGFTEIIKDPLSVTLIEWPERIEGLLPSRTKRISFEYVSDKERKITIK